ncbi:MAG: BamA/TamA family outer membrane protein, partial [Bacteroidetes bacterium]|nr:BamA/TamA family outer membrane protein [Bacteroidota bacterium]
MGKPLLLLMAVFVLARGPARRAAAQAPLFLANEQTTIRSITFTFVDAERYPPQFEPGTLRAQIATQRPGFWDHVEGFLHFLPFFKPDTYLLDPIELQKDVVRLRRFYHQNGYLSPYIDYGTSRLDTTENTIRIVFSIEQGPPIIIQDVAFFSPDGGYATRLFEDETRERWIDFRDRTSFKTGDRYTTFDLFRIQDQVLSWLKDRGYAFARLKTETLIDSTARTADITFALDPGPLSYFSEILIEGAEQVSEEVVRRELPFEQGDLFSNKKLIQGQRELFGLNLFQVALAEVLPTVAHPDSLRPGLQLRDSTVTVRIRVREAKLRSLTAQTGYDRARGITLSGQWAHRNFLGGARHLTLNTTALTGLPENLTSRSDETGVPRLFRGSIALRQPYLGSRSLSGIVEPFLVYERDPLLRNTDLILDINRRELGLNTTLIYEILPFRTVSLQYALSRATKFSSERPRTAATGATIATERDSYNKSIVTLNGTLGWTNNFLNPRRGFLVRPFIERGGGLERLLGLGRSGVEFFKTGVEIVAYIPVTRTINVGARLTGGRLWPTGVSNDPQLLHVKGSDDTVVFDRTFVQPFEDRFDPIRFYAGGSNDVRGWELGLIGPQFNRTYCNPESQCARDENGQLTFVDLDGDGFLEYRRRTPRGLRNQGWKDSDDSISFADGPLAEGAIALAEVQG